MVESHNVGVVREIVRVISEGLYDEVLQYLHPEIVVDCPFPAFHQGPMRRGASQIAAGFAFLPAVFSRFKLTITGVFDCPEQNSVVFEQLSEGVLKATGAAYANRYLMIFGFRDGKIVLWREYFNPEVMNTDMAPLLAFS
jgi:ketosteroid isomerase-like protein